MLDFKQNNKVFANKDERPSRFLIDLKNIKNENLEKKQGKIFKFIHKIKQINFRKINEKDLTKATKKFFTKGENILEKGLGFKSTEENVASHHFFGNKSEINNLKQDEPRTIGFLKNLNNWYSSRSHQFSRLAFFPFIKYLIHFCSKCNKFWMLKNCVLNFFLIDL